MNAKAKHRTKNNFLILNFWNESTVAKMQILFDFSKKYRKRVSKINTYRVTKTQ